MDWVDWHRGYDDAGSRLARRLAIVQEQVRRAVDGLPPGDRTLISLCAGQGRDVIGVLAGHPRRDDVRARLVELDPRNVAAARAAAAQEGLGRTEVVEGDAGLLDHYRPLVPADVVVACGVFGNLTTADLERTVTACRALTQRGGLVIWTRHRGEPDLVPRICDWFERDGFTREFLTPADLRFCVGVHRLDEDPAPLPDGRLFTFVGSDILAAMTDS